MGGQLRTWIGDHRLRCPARSGYWPFHPFQYHRWYGPLNVRLTLASHSCGAVTVPTRGGSALSAYRMRSCRKATAVTRLYQYLVAAPATDCRFSYAAAWHNHLDRLPALVCAHYRLLTLICNMLSQHIFSQLAKRLFIPRSHFQSQFSVTTDQR